MPKVLLLQFDTDPQRDARRDALAKTDAVLIEDEPRWPDFFQMVTRTRPDTIVIAASYMPNYAREAARYLGEGFNTRDIPLVLVDPPADDEAEFEQYVRTYQPRATFTTTTKLTDALRTTSPM